MLDSISNKWSYNPFKMINNSIAYVGIKSKMLLEDAGISSYNPDLNDYDKLSKEDK